jgi:hypothetical protein
LLRNERAVEKIIRERSWGLVGERCTIEEGGFERAFDEWRGKRDGQR